MFKILPPAGSAFSLKERRDWLRGFHYAASRVYKFPNDIEIDIEDGEIVIKRVSAEFRPNDRGSPCVGCPGRYPVPAVIQETANAARQDD
jgi:hypothetical protein